VWYNITVPKGTERKKDQMETQVEKIMRLLHCTEEEAKQVIADDKAIDRGERMAFDLSPEQEKAAKKMANAGTRKAPPVYNFDTSKKVRKENPTKSAIIAELAKFLEENSENACKNVNITNKERMIAFSVGENNYELTLIQKRKSKD
jgi:hypothetical protein